MEEELEGGYFDILRDIISRLGLADVEKFGLTWEDCEDYLLGRGPQQTGEGNPLQGVMGGLGVSPQGFKMGESSQPLHPAHEWDPKPW